MKGIIVIAVINSITVTIMSAYNYFVTVDPDKIKLMQSFGANKWQILTKLILPANGINMINLLKINIGMTWVGVIVGEFIASKAGIGYLIVYGGQVFKLNVVMMGVFVLSILTLIMYQGVNLLETYLRKKQSTKK